MKSKVYLATISLCIAAILYALLALLLPLLVLYVADDDPGTRTENWLGVAILGGFCLALAALMLVVACFVHRRQFWAWIAGLCIFAVFLPSAFLPLGALGLWGLLDRASREEFGVTVKPADRNT